MGRMLAVGLVAVAVALAAAVLSVNILATMGEDEARIRYRLSCAQVYACPDNVTSACGTASGGVCFSLVNAGPRVPQRALERASFEFNKGVWSANETLVVVGGSCRSLADPRAGGIASGQSREVAVANTRFSDYNDILQFGVRPLMEDNEEAPACTRAMRSV